MFSEPAAPPSATRRFFEGDEPTSARGAAPSPPKAPVAETPRVAETTDPIEPPIDTPPTYADPSTLPEAMSDDQIASLSPSDVVMARNRVEVAASVEERRALAASSVAARTQS